MFILYCEYMSATVAIEFPNHASIDSRVVIISKHFLHDTCLNRRFFIVLYSCGVASYPHMLRNETCDGACFFLIHL